MNLTFDPSAYTVETLERDGHTITYRSFAPTPYVSRPVAPELQQLSIYVPECYYAGETLNGYDLHTAPIFFPNSIGGYMPGKIEKPGVDFFGNTNSLFYALLHGYVVVSCGARGRGTRDSQGNYVGMAPAALCDLKAVVRYLRHNADLIPGDVNHVITNGTSAGGAMSSLLGATGNHPDFASYLAEMGAAEESDAVFASSCYCPITNLNHADMAYEWEFDGLYHGKCLKMGGPPPLPEPGAPMPPPPEPEDCDMTQEQIALSQKLAALFPGYLNSLHLTAPDGAPLTLDEGGNGSFKEYVKSFVIASAQKELEQGGDLTGLDWLTIENSKVTDLDFARYIGYRVRMKLTPAFDSVGNNTPENEVFGSVEQPFRHFSRFSVNYPDGGIPAADFQQVKSYNPMYYLDDPAAEKAQHFRLRHGAVDRDTSLAISAMLNAKLQNCGIDTHLAYPWGRPHSGDYDLEELFGWIDQIIKEN